MGAAQGRAQGRECGPAPKHRLFVGVYPPQVVVDTLLALPRPVDAGIRWVPPEQLHVTLRFLGDADPDEVAARLGRTPLPRVTARLGPTVGRLGRTVVMVPVTGLDDLAAAVVGCTADLGEPPDPRPFFGHLTLARLRHRGSCGAAGSRVGLTFDACEVVLVASAPGETGQVHRRVAAFATG